MANLDFYKNTLQIVLWGEPNPKGGYFPHKKINLHYVKFDATPDEVHALGMATKGLIQGSFREFIYVVASNVNG